LETNGVGADKDEVEKHITSGCHGMWMARLANKRVTFCSPQLEDICVVGQPHKKQGTWSLSLLSSDEFGKASSPDSNKQPALRGEAWCSHRTTQVPVQSSCEPQSQEQATVDLTTSCSAHVEKSALSWKWYKYQTADTSNGVLMV